LGGASIVGGRDIGLTVASETVIVETSSGVVCPRCSVADTFAARLRGLMGRGRLADGEGLLIRPASSIHTFFMRFPIDVVFVDRHDSIVKIVPNLRPWRLAWGRKATQTVELPAGSCAAAELAVGERLAFTSDGTEPAA
jgi:uncharacterized protein